MKRRYVAASLLIFLVLVVVYLGFLSGRSGGIALHLIYPETGETFFRVKVGEGDRVVLSYIHSIYLIDVREEFLVRNSSLVLTKITMGDGETIETLDREGAFMLGGSVLLIGQSRSVTAFRLRIGEVGRPSLEVGETRIDLASLAGIGEVVELRLKPG